MPATQRIKSIAPVSPELMLSLGGKGLLNKRRYDNSPPRVRAGQTEVWLRRMLFALCLLGGAPLSLAATVALSASPSTVAAGSASTLTWSSANATSCAASGAWSGKQATNGSRSTGALTATATFSLTCTGVGGPAMASVTISVGSSAITAFANAGSGNVTVTSNNNLSNGAVITISGTTNYNGVYTIANVTATSFTIVATFVANDATGAWQFAGGMIPGCSTSGATGAIALSNVPSRFMGVAPLSVFFDASGSTATATTRPFHDLEYRWNFGDSAGSPVSGTTWGYGSRVGVSSRNTATGPVAAHVFETPGSYTVALTATDGTNTVSNSCAQILVQDPGVVFSGANTICVGATSLPVQGQGGCPAGANTAQQANFATAINTYALTGKRVLFKRGDTFSAPTSAAITRTGPGIIGAFGTGASPSVQMTGSTTILNLSSASTPTITDWRVMDLDLNGMSNAASMGIGTAGSINQVTLLRLNIHDTHNGISFSDSLLDWLNNNGSPGQTMWDQIAIVDSSVLHTMGGVGGNGVGVAAKRLSMLGNLVDDSSLAEHILRVFNVSRGVISNNTLSKQAAAKAIIKMHGPTWLSGTPPSGVAGSYTELAVLSDNKFVAADGTDWTINTGPQNAQSDERLRNIILERNWFIGGNTTQVGLVVNAVDETVRNNISVNTAGKFMQVSYRSGASTGLEPAPLNIHIYNNTVYSSSAQSGDLIGVDIRAPSANTVVYNNLGTGPFASVLTMVSNAGTGTVQGNNPIYLPSALFASATPAIPADFSLKPLPNPARDTGLSSVPVWSDFFLTNRPQSGVPGVIDLGAAEGS